MNKITGKNIKAIREDNRLTQIEFAEILEVTQATVSNWEVRNQLPHPDNIKAMHDKFGVTREDIFSESGYYARTRGLLENKAPEHSISYLEDENLGKVWCPPEFEGKGNFFVRVDNESMNNVLPIGSLALVDVSKVPSHGEIGYVAVGSDRVIRRVKETDEVLFLEPDCSSSDFRRKVIDKTDPKSPKIHVFGRVMWAQINL